MVTLTELELHEKSAWNCISCEDQRTPRPLTQGTLGYMDSKKTTVGFVGPRDVPNYPITELHTPNLRLGSRKCAQKTIGEDILLAISTDPTPGEHPTGPTKVCVASRDQGTHRNPSRGHKFTRGADVRGLIFQTSMELHPSGCHVDAHRRDPPSRATLGVPMYSPCQCHPPKRLPSCPQEVGFSRKGPRGLHSEGSRGTAPRWVPYGRPSSGPTR
jgi:hypothetical protein